jgi:putative protein-disulfide isomerase
MNDKTLWYIADPMCSWCWGFSPVIEAILQEYRDRLKIELVLGGLRPGTKAPMAAAQREEILHHWHDVQHMTGQPFQFEGAMPAGFIYDTEPASRSVVSVGALNPQATFPFFKTVQYAFYAGQQNVTQPEVLAQLADSVGVDAQRFLRMFESEEAKKKTLDHFQKARDWGVRGFPSLITQGAAGYNLLASGCRPLEEMRAHIDEWLRG